MTHKKLVSISTKVTQKCSNVFSDVKVVSQGCVDFWICPGCDVLNVSDLEFESEPPRSSD